MQLLLSQWPGCILQGVSTAPPGSPLRLQNPEICLPLDSHRAPASTVRGAGFRVCARSTSMAEPCMRRPVTLIPMLLHVAAADFATDSRCMHACTGGAFTG